MSKTIKSITFSAGKSFPAQKRIAAALISFAKNNPDNVSIEYNNISIEYTEHEKTQKFPNGAEILAPEEGTEFYYWRDSYKGHENGVSSNIWSNNHIDFVLLRNQSVFLDEDKCEDNHFFKKRHFEIVNKVYEINTENNWFADWSKNVQPKHFCYWSYDGNEAEFVSRSYIQSGGEIYYCKQAEEYLKTLSGEDIKAFLLIYT